MIRKCQTDKQISNSLSVKYTLVRSMQERIYRRRRPRVKHEKITKKTKEKIASERGKLNVERLSEKYGVNQNSVRTILSRDQEYKMKKRITEERRELEKKLKSIKEIEKIAKEKAKIENIKQIINKTSSSRIQPIKGR